MRFSVKTSGNSTTCERTTHARFSHFSTLNKVLLQMWHHTLKINNGKATAIKIDTVYKDKIHIQQRNNQCGILSNSFYKHRALICYNILYDSDGNVLMSSNMMLSLKRQTAAVLLYPSVWADNATFLHNTAEVNHFSILNCLQSHEDTDYRTNAKLVQTARSQDFNKNIADAAKLAQNVSDK